MNPFARLFGSAAPPPAAQHSQLYAPSQMMPASLNATRRELLRVVLRDTLNKHGIPSAWIGADVLTAMGRDREPGIHLRILLKHWEPRLMECAVAFQRSLVARAELFDPQVGAWLMGISWQYALQDESRCPAMPDPVSWTAPRPAPAAPAPVPEDRKAALRRLLDDGPAGADRPNFEQTQPMFAATEPARF